MIHVRNQIRFHDNETLETNISVFLAPPSTLARTEASFGRVHLTALRGGFGSYSITNKMMMVVMIYLLLPILTQTMDKDHRL